MHQKHLAELLSNEPSWESVLSAEDRQRLAALLADRSERPEWLTEAFLHGYFYCLAVTPLPLDEGDWWPPLRSLLKVDDDKELRELLSGMFRGYQQGLHSTTVTALPAPGAEAEPADLSDWARGIILGLELVPEWWNFPESDIPLQQNPEREASKNLIVVLAGLVKWGRPSKEESPATEEDAAEKPPVEEDEWMHTAARSVRTLLLQMPMLYVLRKNLERMESEAPRSRRKVGRNDPCPCGSGKKYKKCCGR